MACCPRRLSGERDVCASPEPPLFTPQCHPPPLPPWHHPHSFTYRSDRIGYDLDKVRADFVKSGGHAPVPIYIQVTTPQEEGPCTRSSPATFNPPSPPPPPRRTHQDQLEDDPLVHQWKRLPEFSKWKKSNLHKSPTLIKWAKDPEYIELLEKCYRLTGLEALAPR